MSKLIGISKNERTGNGYEVFGKKTGIVYYPLGGGAASRYDCTWYVHTNIDLDDREKENVESQERWNEEYWSEECTTGK